MANTNKNFTVTMTMEMHEKLNKLVEKYQEPSIAVVKKSNVIEHLINKDYEEKYGKQSINN